MDVKLEEKLCKKYPRLTRIRGVYSYYYVPFFGLRIKLSYSIALPAIRFCQRFYKKATLPRYYPEGCQQPFAMFGFECGDGWYGLIDKMLEQLTPLCDELERETEHYPYICQLKEKYAELRVYLSSESDEMSQVIRDAEAASVKTCEVCGQPGQVTGKGWYSTRCEACLRGNK